ncbi:MAG TPA: hypothetical protein VMI32_04290 [Candidatus Solibacter sp.]|nr:hypothetical protein [Candidatus Solibacter sp.]
MRGLQFRQERDVPDVRAAHVIQDNGNIPESGTLVHHQEHLMLRAGLKSLPNFSRQVITCDSVISKIDPSVSHYENLHGVISKSCWHACTVVGDVLIYTNAVVGSSTHHGDNQE